MLPSLVLAKEINKLSLRERKVGRQAILKRVHQCFSSDHDHLGRSPNRSPGVTEMDQIPDCLLTLSLGGQGRAGGRTSRCLFSPPPPPRERTARRARRPTRSPASRKVGRSGIPPWKGWEASASASASASEEGRPPAPFLLPALGSCEKSAAPARPAQRPGSAGRAETPTAPQSPPPSCSALPKARLHVLPPRSERVRRFKRPAGKAKPRKSVPPQHQGVHRQLSPYANSSPRRLYMR